MFIPATDRLVGYYNFVATEGGVVDSTDESI